MKKIKIEETAQENLPVDNTQQINWAQYAGAGTEAVTAEDLGTPFLTIIQKGSPEVDRTHPAWQIKRIEGAEPGDIINTVSRKIVWTHNQDPLLFVPCSYLRLYVEWKPRSSGGGFVRQHTNPAILTECTRNERNQDVLPNGNLIVTTAYFFGFALVDDQPEKSVIAMSSTQLKKARAWLNLIMSRKQRLPSGEFILLPMFSAKYAIQTVPEQNVNGNWFGWTIQLAGPVTSPDLINLCYDVSKQVASVPQRLMLEQSAAPQEDAF